MSAQKDYRCNDFYDFMVNLLNNQDKVKLKELKKGDSCIYFSTWQVPYQLDSELCEEDCVEVIIGTLNNSANLTFSEALCLNSYHGNLRYSDNIVAWSRDMLIDKIDLIKIDYEIYEKIKNELQIEDWDKEVSYKELHVTKFVRFIEEFFTKPLVSEGEIEEDMEETIDLFEKEPEPKKIDFKSVHFYDNLINLLNYQEKLETEDLDFDQTYIHQYSWREPYKVGDTIVYENCAEIYIGTTKKARAASFSEVLSLNTYQGSINYFSGNIRGLNSSRASEEKFIPVNNRLFEQIKILIKPDKWEKPTSYKQRYMTAFVRSMENYFLGNDLGKNFKIIQKEYLVKKSPGQDAVISIYVEAPEIAEEAKPGQFVVLRLHQRGERIPLTLTDTDKEKGIIRLIYQVIGTTTKELESLNEGDYILDLLGPLGEPVEIKKHDKPVICVAGGVGSACIFSKVKAMKAAGNYVITIIGAKSKNSLILEKEMREISDEFYITTDDGLCQCDDDGNECFHKECIDGTKIYGGFVNYLVEAMLGRKNLLEKDNQRIEDPNKKYTSYGPGELFGKFTNDDIAEIIAVGPIPMMWAVVNVVAGNGKYIPELHYRKSLIKTLVSLNPVMIDGTGMCGGCRISLYNPETKKYEKKFACVDGPVFDGHLVNFESLFKRTSQYSKKEVEAVRYLELVGW